MTKKLEELFDIASQEENELNEPIPGVALEVTGEAISNLEKIENVEDLRRLNINTLKIEGRLKSPEYVASAVKAYRNKIDNNTINKSELENMEISFSRGFFNGWFDGVNHQKLVNGEYSKHIFSCKLCKKDYYCSDLGITQDKENLKSFSFCLWQ